jgi:hypothetical protein
VCKAGSLGYLVAQEQVGGGYNSWNMSILFTKFGKSGKSRIYPLLVNPFIIGYDTLNKVDRIIMDTVKFYEGIEPRPLMNKGVYLETNLGATSLEPISMEHKNLLDLSDNEFTAYIIALSLFIRKLSDRMPISNLHHIPGLRFGKFVADGSDLAAIHANFIGYYILYGLRLRDDEEKVGIDTGSGKAFAESYIERIDNRAGREELLFKLHMALAMSKRAFLKYNKLIYSCTDNIDARINDILKYYKHNKKKLASIKKDERVHKDLHAKAVPNRHVKVPRKGRMKFRRALG